MEYDCLKVLFDNIVEKSFYLHIVFIIILSYDRHEISKIL